MRKIYWLGSALLASACSSPLAPAYVPPVHPAHKLPQPVAACAIAFSGVSSNPREGTLTVTNTDTCERRVGVAIYVISPSGQTLFANVAQTAAAGETVSLRAGLPPCARYQFDPYHTLLATAVPADGHFGQGEYLFPGPYYGDTMASCPREAAPAVEPPVAPPVVVAPNNVPPAPPQEVPGKPPVVVPGLPPVEVPGLPPAPVPGLPPVVVPPAPEVPTPREVPPQPVCPTVTVDNWRAYVTHASVVASEGTATARFTVRVPAGCTVPLSLVSYQISNCGTKFPQVFVAGSEPARGRPYGPGTYVNEMRVPVAPVNGQADLRLDGYTAEALTVANEAAYYEQRTIAWWVDRACLPEGM